MQNKRWAYLAVLFASIGVGIAAVYVTTGHRDNAPATTSTRNPEPAGTPRPGTPLTVREPLARGDMAAYVANREPAPLPEIVFTDVSGASGTLARWKGKTILLNIWATWCAPCRKEMPELDRLQGELGSVRFEVVTLAVDRTGVEGAKAFFEKIGVRRLAVYADATMRASSALRVVGMPTTLLIDPEGRELGRLTGPAKWDGADAKALIGAILDRQR